MGEVFIRIKYIAALVLIAGSTLPVRAVEYYVATNGTGAGTSWPEAFTNIQQALDAAGDDSTIYLAGRTFLTTAHLAWASAANVTVRGGYEATNTAAVGSNNPALWPTVIQRSGAFNHRIFYLPAVTNGVLRDVTVTGGRLLTGSCYGGGLYIQNAVNFRMLNCRVTNNAVGSDVNSVKAGGGLYWSGGNGALVDCVIAGNSAYRSGGGGGTGYSRGGGVFAQGGTLAMSNCLVYGNTTLEAWNNYDSSAGGGLAFVSGTQALVNCLVINNYCNGYNGEPRGSALYTAGTLTADQCTFAYNLGEGILRGGGSAVISNSIVWANGDDIDGALIVDHSCVEDGDSNGVNGNIMSDPLFEYGFYLGAGSPCTNAGSQDAGLTAVNGLTTRADGAADSGLVDMGYHAAGGKDPERADLYVVPGGAGAKHGRDSDNALGSIGGALALAGIGTYIHIGAGPYTNGLETFPLTVGQAGVRLLGTNASATLLDTTGSGKRALTIAPVAPVRIEALTLAGGTSTADPLGGGLFAYRCAGLDIENCVIRSNNVAGGVNTAKAGGGIFADDSYLRVTGCTISGNKAYRNSGGGGTGYSRGAGVYASGGEVWLIGCMIRDNQALESPNNNDSSFGGGLYLANGNHAVRNCLVINNYCNGYNYNARGSAIYASGPVAVEYSTVSGNLGEGIRCGSATLTISNSIVWGNGDDLYGSGIVPDHSCVEDGDSNGVNGNIMLDPLFEYGFYLGSGSPCTNAGSMDVSASPVTGLTTRTDGVADTGIVDMGYHYATGMDSALADLYVAAGGTGSCDGSDWDNALASISDALALAIIGTRIHVAAGHYTNGLEQFPLTISAATDLQILGTNAAETRVNAEGSSARVMTISGSARVTVDGLTLCGGRLYGSVYGGGLWIGDSSDVMITNCQISSNLLEGGVNNAKCGGGLYIQNSEVTLSRCRVSGNTARLLAGGGGDGWSCGGGLYVASGSLNLFGSIVSSNQALGYPNNYQSSAGGGVYLAGGPHYFRNCLIHTNVCKGNDGAPRGSAIYGAGVILVENCTVVDNWGEGFRYGSGTFAVTNTIFSGHTADVTNFPTDGGGHLLNMGYSRIAVPATMDGFNGCVSSDPMFLGAESNNYRLSKGSPAIDAGEYRLWMIDATDLDGCPRIKGGVPDIGAYESAYAKGSVLSVR